MIRTPNRRIALVALLVLVFDQLTKLAVLKYLGYAQERVIVPGFSPHADWISATAASPW